MNCDHGYPEDICWVCHPDILKRMHEVYEPNIERLRLLAESDPSFKELYLDIRCMGTVDIDWDTVWLLCDQPKTNI